MKGNMDTNNDHLTAVKAMLVDALRDSWSHHGEPRLMGSPRDFIGFDDVALIDADKLAATVIRWVGDLLEAKNVELMGRCPADADPVQRRHYVQASFEISNIRRDLLDIARKGGR